MSRPSTEMIRIAMQDGRLSTDLRAGGRGAWLCPDLHCCETALKRRAVARALRTEVPFEALEELRVAFVTETAFPLDRSFVKR